MRFEDHQSLHLHLFREVPVLLLVLLDQQHVLVYPLEEFLEELGLDEVLELFGDDEVGVFGLFLLHAQVVLVWMGRSVLM